MQLALHAAQIILSLCIILFVLLQQRGTGLFGIFGGSGEFYATRRGLEKGFFVATLVCAALLAASVIVSFVV